MHPSKIGTYIQSSRRTGQTKTLLITSVSTSVARPSAVDLIFTQALGTSYITTDDIRPALTRPPPPDSQAAARAMGAWSMPRYTVR